MNCISSTENTERCYSFKLKPTQHAKADDKDRFIRPRERSSRGLPKAYIGLTNVPFLPPLLSIFDFDGFGFFKQKSSFSFVYCLVLNLVNFFYERTVQNCMYNTSDLHKNQIQN